MIFKTNETHVEVDDFRADTWAEQVCPIPVYDLLRIISALIQNNVVCRFESVYSGINNSLQNR